MLASDGYVLHSKSPDFSYEGFEEFPDPGTAGMEQADRDSWSTRMTKVLRHGTAHPHVKDLTSLMHDILKAGDQPLTIEETREILGGNHHFRVRSVKGEGDKVEHMVIVTEGPEPDKCEMCKEEGRWHRAARSRQKEAERSSQNGGRRNRHRGGHRSPPATVDYSQL